LALVEVSVVEQRYQAVLMVQSGARVTDVAARFGVSRQSVHNWIAAYRDGGLGGLDSKSRRPVSCPWQAEPAVEAAACEMRREHAKLGAGADRVRAGQAGLSGCGAVADDGVPDSGPPWFDRAEAAQTPPGSVCAVGAAGCLCLQSRSTAMSTA
jgi:transposase-like protein